MPKTLICLNYIHLQPRASSLKEDLAATKQSFAFVSHGRHREDIKGEEGRAQNTKVVSIDAGATAGAAEDE